MNNTMRYKSYAGTVEYSEEDDILFGKIIGIDDSISYEGESLRELKESFQEAVDDYLEHCKNIGKSPDKAYTGKFMIRLDPGLHARLANQAEAAGKSLNQYATEILASA